MHLVRKHAEKEILKRMDAALFNTPHIRCMLLRLSKAEPTHDYWNRDVVLTARDVLQDETTEIYFCNDRDVFIISHGLNYKKLQQFMTHLTQKLSPAPLEGLASLFEVSVDLETIRVIFENKLRNLEPQNLNEKDHENLNRRKAVDALNQELIKTLTSRRSERKTLEILVVEDDGFSQMLIKNTIGRKYSVTVTGDGQGAILNYLTKAPDILFLDIGLPDINGHDVLKKIFEIDPGAYVVMFSGQGDRDNIIRAIELGAKGFVGKPFTQEKLLQYIDRSPYVIDKKNQGDASWIS